MGEHEKQPLESEICDLLESQTAKPQPDDSAPPDQPANNWEGYSIEILSIWFDP
jgi:hypothetical protein